MDRDMDMDSKHKERHRGDLNIDTVDTEGE